MIAPGISPIQSITPESLFGWGGFIFGLVAIGIRVWEKITGRTKSIASVENKLDHLCRQIEDMEGRLEVVDGLASSVRELTQEWRGPPGSSNGYRSIIQENQRRIAAIEKRNYELDAIKKARDEDERRSGGQHRRLMDRELNNLLPEDREDRG